MIYIKTDIGRQALKARSESMPRKYHFPFLMFDGKRDSTEILSASASHGFTSVDLYEMVQAGFITLQAPTSVIATTTKVSNETAASSAERFAKLKRNASHYLEDLLGPNAQGLCLQLEACKTQEAFDASLEKTVNIISQTTNPAKAAAYKERVLAS